MTPALLLLLLLSALASEVASVASLDLEQRESRATNGSRVRCTRSRTAPKVWRPRVPLRDIQWADGCAKTKTDDGYWTMLSAYRAGSPDYDWIYTDDIDNSRCLQFWTYYDKNGKKAIGRVLRTTKQADFWNKRWCPLPYGYKHGDEGKLWMYCTCTYE